MRMVIDGLTDRQVQLCDMLWACDTEEDILELALALPPVERDQLAVLKEMMILEASEEQLNGMSTFPDADALLKKIKKN